VLLCAAHCFRALPTQVAFWDTTTRQMIRGDPTAPSAINLFVKSLTSQAGGAHSGWRYRVALKGNLQQLPTAAEVPVGTPITVFPRGGQHSLRLMNCTACKITNVSIYGGSSMGVVDSNGGGGNVYTSLFIGRAPNGAGPLPPRFLSTNADGFHSTTNRVGPSLLGSEVSFTGATSDVSKRPAC
jgi:hypothetical protein